MKSNSIYIKGARENNLKNIDIEIPRDKLVVFTGVSGSGKTSLAFDTIYAEGQRRYIESLSSYARQFLGQMDKPDVDYIEGLSPAIAIDQKTTSRNPRSTVGTVTEIHDYLRLLYARIGKAHCPNCGKPITQQTVDQMVDMILSYPEGTKFQILSPVVRGKKGENVKLLSDIKKSGFLRVCVDGITYELDDEISMDKNKKHNIEVIVDRLVVKEGIKHRLTDSIETALKLSDGIILVDFLGLSQVMLSQNFACPDCGIGFEAPEPKMFSFNSPFGACPACLGIGEIRKVDTNLLLPDRTKSIYEGAFVNIGKPDGWIKSILEGLAVKYDFSLSVPVNELPDKIVEMLFYGNAGEKYIINAPGGGTVNSAFEGFVNTTERRYKQTDSDYSRMYYEEFMSVYPCETCKGTRYKKESLAFTVGGKNIDEISRLPITDERDFFLSLKLTERETVISDRILKEINARIGFLCDVGLGYLALARNAGTLSGGEAQRIRLATQIGSGLTGVLYVLDEPSIGLHQRDNSKLLATLKKLRDLGNTLIVVEHDEETMFEADHIVDIGPLAGINGGYLVAQGTAREIMNNPNSITGKYLSGELKIRTPSCRRSGNGNNLSIIGAEVNNLKCIDVSIPLGVFCVVTGVSGSGKSSLINEILYKKLAHDLNRARTRAGKCKEIIGVQNLDKVINIDQSPIGRTPRSNPATYTGMFDLIRTLFAATPDAKMNGFKSGRFSFNIKGGRCEACQGDGIIKIEMHFLSDVYVPCEVCKGKRYNRETLQAMYKGKNISDVLDMTVEEAMDFFKNIPPIRRKVESLYDVGLGYIKLGQSSTTLSGGEAQRVKLATELSKRSTGKTMYILDEPTTGLHMADVDKLIAILQKLVDSGNSVVVIEHNLDVIKCADYIIDMGPEGGNGGGQIIAVGTPEEVSKIKNSFTGNYIAKVL